MVGLVTLGRMSWIRTSRGRFWSHGKRDLPFHKILFIQFLLSQTETIERSEKYGILGLVVCSDLSCDPCREKAPKVWRKPGGYFNGAPNFSMLCLFLQSHRCCEDTSERRDSYFHCTVVWVWWVCRLIVFCPSHCSKSRSLLVSSQPRADKLKVLPPGCSTLQAFCLPWYFQLPPLPQIPLGELLSGTQPANYQPLWKCHLHFLPLGTALPNH